MAMVQSGLLPRSGFSLSWVLFSMFSIVISSAVALESSLPIIAAGISLSDKELIESSYLDHISSRRLADLAGNAFATPHVAVCLLLTVAVLGRYLPDGSAALERLRRDALHLCT